MQALDLVILALACYLLTDTLVNRALPWNIMGYVRERTQWTVLTCFYCSAFWAGIAVYVAWLIQPQVVYPLAIGGGAVLAWRYTGANHT